MRRAIENDIDEIVGHYLHADKINPSWIVGFSNRKGSAVPLQLMRRSVDRTREQSKSMTTRETCTVHNYTTVKNFTTTEYVKIKLVTQKSRFSNSCSKKYAKGDPFKINPFWDLN